MKCCLTNEINGKVTRWRIGTWWKERWEKESDREKRRNQKLKKGNNSRNRSNTSPCIYIPNGYHFSYGYAIALGADFCFSSWNSSTIGRRRPPPTALSPIPFAVTFGANKQRIKREIQAKIQRKFRGNSERKIGCFYRVWHVLVESLYRQLGGATKGVIKRGWSEMAW